MMSHGLLGACRQVILPAHSRLIMVLGQHVPAAVTHFLAIFLFDPRYAVVARMRFGLGEMEHIAADGRKEARQGLLLDLL